MKVTKMLASKPYYKRRGLTFMELMIAIIILGVLATLAIPTFQKAIIKSKYVQGLITAKAIWEGESFYYEGYGSYLDMGYYTDDVENDSVLTRLDVKLANDDEFEYGVFGTSPGDPEAGEVRCRRIAVRNLGIGFKIPMGSGKVIPGPGWHK